MKLVFAFLLLSSSVFAADPAPRLLWWELPGAVKSDKRPFFEALNQYRRNTAEASLLADYVTTLVVCEIETAFAERDCPAWRRQIAVRAEEGAPASLAAFGASPENARFLLQAFAGMLKGVQGELAPTEKNSAAALLTQAGTLLALDPMPETEWAKLDTLLRNSPALAAAIAGDASLRPFTPFYREFAAWAAARPSRTSLHVPDPARFFVGQAGFCRLEGRAFVCEGGMNPGKVPVFQDPQQIAAVFSGLCVLDGHEVKCWNVGTVDPLKGAGYLVAPANLKNPYFLRSDIDGKRVCALDEDGLKCWGPDQNKPDQRPNAAVLTSPTRRYSSFLASDYVICGLGDLGVYCWDHWQNGNRDDRELFHDITNFGGGARALAYTNGYFCVAHEKGIRCWTSGSVVSDIASVMTPSLAAGANHVCWLASDAVSCWGDDSYGQATVPRGLGNVHEVVAGDNATCALDEHGWSCWGSYRSGAGVPPKVLRHPRLLAAAEKYTFALDDYGLLGWGDTGKLPPRAGWQDVRFLLTDTVDLYYANTVHLFRDGKPIRWVTNPTEIAAYLGAVCVIDDHGLDCRDLSYQDRYIISSPPERHPHSISITYDKQYAFLDDNGVYSNTIPTRVYAGKKLAALALEFDFACAIDVEGKVSCWMNNYDTFQPTITISGLRKFVHDNRSFCALDDAGVRCWGHEGKLPVPDGLKHPFELAMGRGHTCVIDDDGVKCWGFNYAGQATPLPTVKENP